MPREPRREEDHAANAFAALTILAGFTPERLDEVRREHFAAFMEGFTRSGQEPPAWIEELRRMVHGETQPRP